MLAPHLFGTVTTSEASQKAEEFSNMIPFGGEKIRVKVVFVSVPHAHKQHTLEVCLTLPLSFHPLL